jgi:MoxR-like ATPase
MKTNQAGSSSFEQLASFSNAILSEVEKAVVGKRDTLCKILTALLSAGGHILLEDYPGMAKTLIAKSFATALGLEFKRIQFTPDLLPGDITGGYVYDTGQNKFFLRKGPIFTNILLADEINRASPRTQSAMLEAMQEYQVSIEGESFPLPDPFIVIATQNPIEYEGTFPLPEAQLDRFLVKVAIGYPGPDDEQEILNRRLKRKQDQIILNSAVNLDIFLEMRKKVEGVYVHPDVQRYIIDTVTKTRGHRQVSIGVSPRGSLALLKLARAWAAFNGRDYVLPDDVKVFAHCALGHRIILEPNLWGKRNAEEAVIDEVVQSVSVPLVVVNHEA